MLEGEISFQDSAAFGVSIGLTTTGIATDHDASDFGTFAIYIRRGSGNVDIEVAVLVGVFVATAGSITLQRSKPAVGNGVGDFAHSFYLHVK